MKKLTKPKKSQCPICKNSYLKFNTFQKVCNSIDCAMRWALENQKRKRKKQTRKELREFNESQISYWRDLTQRNLNFWIVNCRDILKPCVTCGKKQRFDEYGAKIGRWNASHYKTRGGHPELALCVWNIHKSCSQCNHEKSGNIIKYKDTIKDRITAEQLDWIHGPHERQNMTIGDYKLLNQEFTRWIKRDKDKHKNTRLFTNQQIQ